MATLIKCPGCSFEFPLEDALNDELTGAIEKEKQELRQQMVDYKKTIDEGVRKKEEELNKQKQLQEEEFTNRLESEIKRKNAQMEESLRKSLHADYENQLKLLKQSASDADEKLKLSRKREIEFLQLEQELKNKEAELELQVQRQLMLEREKIKEHLQKEEHEKMQLKEDEHKLRLKELEKQLDDQKKLADEMKHKAAQGDALNLELKDAIEKEKQDLRQQMLDFKSKEKELLKQQEEFNKQRQQQEDEFASKLEEEVKKKNTQLEESLRKSFHADYENQLNLLKQSVIDSEEKLKSSRKKEMEFLEREHELKNKEAELELQVKRQLIQEREKIKEHLQKEEQEKMQLKEDEYKLRLKELEKQLDDQKKLADEMKRKAEQGSMQLQGEVQELLLQEILQSTFPFDRIDEVGKGVRGADCIHVVRNQFGNEAGKIVYESKRTKDFAHDWIDKLKADMRSLGTDVAVIVTQALPKDMERFGEKNGVYICTFTEVRSVALLLRNAILKIADLKKSQENKGDKMVMLYDYLTGHEFNEQWKAIREGFMSMKLSILKERDAMEKLWKAREKQLEKVLLNAAHIKGSVEGIAGADAVNLNLLEDSDQNL